SRNYQPQAQARGERPHPALALGAGNEGATMPRPVILFSGPFADLPLEELAPQAGEWGYQGLELCCWGDHFEVQRALSEPDYCQHKQELLTRHDLQPLVVSN